MATSMRTIAERTGYSTATVSMALRGIGRIPEDTRARIAAAAQELGYQVSPILSRAFQLARQPERSRYKETLALILEFPLESNATYQNIIFESALKSGEALGYKVDPFQVSGNPAEQRRLNRILRARGIRGLIISPRLEHKFPRLHFEWSQFAAVEIGRTLWIPRNLHRVERPVYHEILETYHLLKKAGYRRIGMAVEPMADKNRQMVYTAAANIAQEQFHHRQAIPPLSHYGSWEESTFRAWYERYRPDVLIVHSNVEVPRWIGAMGLRAPEDVSLFGCNVAASTLSGLSSDTARFGENSVEMLSILLERDQLGLTEAPYNWMVRGLWQPGASLARSIAPAAWQGG